MGKGLIMICKLFTYGVGFSSDGKRNVRRKEILSDGRMFIYCGIDNYDYVPNDWKLKKAETFIKKGNKWIKRSEIKTFK